MGEGAPKASEPAEEQQETDGTPVYLMEVGRRRERMKEAIHLVPLMFKQTIQFFVIALLSLGMPRKKIETMLREMVDEAFAKSTALREKADERFEKNANAMRAKKQVRANPDT